METNHEIQTEKGILKLNFCLLTVKGVMVGISAMYLRDANPDLTNDYNVVEIKISDKRVKKIICNMSDYKDTLLEVYKRGVICEFCFVDSPIFRYPIFVSVKMPRIKIEGGLDDFYNMSKCV